MSNLPTCG